MCEAAKSPVDRQFRRHCQIAASLSLMLYIVCSQVAMRYVHGIGSLVLAGLAGAFFFTELVSVGLLVVRIRDEFQRVLLARSFLWATVITMGFTTIWGFVELRSHGTVPHLPILSIPFILIFVTTAAKVFIFRLHRSPVE